MAKFVACVLLAAFAAVGSAQTLDWWQTTIVYQVYPRSFKDSDGNGVGDLAGIRSKLTYFNDLGIETIWVSPFYRSPMADFGHDVANFTEVDPLFGTVEDFKSLVDEAHNLGLKVVIDFVPNHSSDEHIWFQKSSNPSDPEYEKYKDYYIWLPPKENGDPPTNWQSLFGGPAWQFNEARGEFYLHQFHRKQPDLNYRNPDVVAEMEDVLRFWLDLGIDGYRIDAIPHLFEDPTFPDIVEGQPSPIEHQRETFEMVYHWRDMLDEYSRQTNQTKLMMTDAIGDMPTLMLYQGNGTHQGAHFTFNFIVFAHKLNMNSTAQDFNDTVSDWLTGVGDRWSNWVVGNHDNHRVAGRFERELVDGLNMFNLLLPGTAVTYYGEEIGMEDNTAITYEMGVDPQGCQVENIEDFPLRTRDFQRTPFQWDDTTSAGFSTNSTPWLPVHENYLTLNLQAELAAEKSHWKIYRKLVDTRKAAVIELGETRVNYVDNVWGFIRKLGTESYTVLINVGDVDQTVDIVSLFPNAPETVQVYLSSLESAYSEGDVLTSASVVLRPKESVVLYGNDI